MGLKEKLKSFKDSLNTFFDEMEKEDEEELKKKKGTEDSEEMPGWAQELKKSVVALQESDKEVHKAIDALCKKGTKDESEEEEEKDEKESKKEEEEEKASKDKKKKTKDSLDLRDAIARAEIIKPGFAPRGTTSDAIRVETLEEVYRDEKVKPMIDAYAGEEVKDFRTLDKAIIDAAFIGISTLMGRSNDEAFKHFTALVADRNDKLPSPVTINETNKKFWETH